MKYYTVPAIKVFTTESEACFCAGSNVSLSYDKATNGNQESEFGDDNLSKGSYGSWDADE